MKIIYQSSDGKQFNSKEECKNYERNSIVEKPDIVENPDLSPLINMLKEYVDYCDSGEYHCDNDWENYIYEQVLETFFGDDFWGWFNNVTN